MDFEFDSRKSTANKAKHGVDFVEAQALWLDPDALAAPADSSQEPRIGMVAKMGEKVWFAVYTMRGGNIRPISVRAARRKEVKRYEGS